MQPVAVDVGHEDVKAWWAHDRSKWAALIHPAPSETELGEYAQKPPAVTINGVEYVVGEAAREVASALWSRDKANDEDTMRLHLVAAAELGANGPVQLATGLPLSWWDEQRDDYKKALQGYGGVVITTSGITRNLWFEKVIVLPQGLIAAGPVLSGPKYPPGPYLVIDFGSRTVDFLIVWKTATGGWKFDTKKADSLVDMGTHEVDAAMATKLSKKYHTVFTAPQIAKVDVVYAHGQAISIAEERFAQQTRLAEAVVRALQEKLGNRMDQVLGTVVVGGGSHLIKRIKPDWIQPPDPEWATVRGMYAAVVEAVRNSQANRA